VLLCAGSAFGIEPGAATLPASAREPAADDISDHIVVLMFDDGWHCVFTDAYPLLKTHGMTAVLPLISDYVSGGGLRRTGTPYGYMNRAEVQEMIDSLGIEIASHSKSHPFLTRLSDAAIRDELQKSRQALESMFRQDITTFVYPYGDYDRRVRRLVADAGYSVARSVRPGSIDFSERPYDLPSSEVRKTTSLSTVENWIAGRSVLILFLHRVVPVPAHYTDWGTDQFAGLLDWLDANKVQVATLRDLYRSRGLPRPLTSALRRSWKDRIEWDLLEEIDFDITGTAKRR
jgi:peptidoglycan/xylan/chitin deacetylase (PgdA/CDA1 family)